MLGISTDYLLSQTDFSPDSAGAYVVAIATMGSPDGEVVLLPSITESSDAIFFFTCPEMRIAKSKMRSTFVVQTLGTKIT